MNDDDLIATVRRAAGAVPASAPDLGSVQRRHRRRRSRHAVATGAAVLALLAGASAVAARLTPSTAPAPAASAPSGAPSPTSTDAAAPPVQIHRHGDSVFTDEAGKELGFRLPHGLVTLSGTRISAVDKPSAVDGVRQWLPLPGGGYILLGSKDLAPGTQRTDGVNVTDLEVRLVTLAADGHVTMSRNVRIQGKDVALAGVGEIGGAAVAYLARTHGGMVAHNLATGAETRLTALDAAVADPANTYSVQHGVLLSASSGTCQLRAWDLRGRALWTRPGQPATGDRCAYADEAAVSPDGRRLAFPIVSYPDRDRAVTRLAIVDLAHGTVRTADISQVTAVGSMIVGAGILGLAWSGDVIHVAWPALPRPADRVYELSEVLSTTDIPST
ncbi:hypothetical protein [Dactylosporangium sp. NPDC000521]|uniref:hypothetical protein n=1 Tax=Dactylosporangium sp. NPDC000521 TaxID=3363975 RepID=UPI0036BBFC65